MTRRAQLAGSLSALLVLACGSGPLTSPSIPPASPTPEGVRSTPAATITASPSPSATTPLRIVGLGDSYMSAQNAEGQSFIDVYAASLESTIGRPVEVTLISSGDMTTAKLKASLANNASVRDSVANADILVISVGGNDSDPFGIFPDGTCAPTQPLPACLQAYSPTLAGNYEAILTSIATLRDGKATAVRVTSMDDPFVGWPEAPSETFARDFFAQVAEAQTQAIFSAAERHGAKTVDYLHVFSGTDGLADPAQYLAADHSHPGELGIQVIADLLMGIGIPELGST